ncbi:hypothetical protein TH25_19780 [Thalassospira profundimaris]|uniref:Uncharacterized protein n=2 Tax=Thalassospira profundimaris TaxID=502049 RepID=A0A367WRY7_9PROT|nr:hypothetical protein TH25_19780 [Thalassospira profundimaris]
MPTPYNVGKFAGSDYIQTYHLFIVYHDLNKTILYRGGPARGGMYADLVLRGLAQQYESPTKEYGDIDWPFDNLVTNRMEGVTENYDYEEWKTNGSQPRHMVTIAQGPDYCGLDEEFTSQARRIGLLGRTYNAIDIDRTDNSNATVYTILQEMGLPLTKPDVHAPGWGTNLHLETTLPEEVLNGINDRIEPVRREIDWFNGLSPLDQVRVLQRAFGGP